MPTLRDQWRESGRVAVAFSGPVRMADGIDYNGPVWRLRGDPRLFVTYREELHEVQWSAGAFRIVAADRPASAEPVCKPDGPDRTG